MTTHDFDWYVQNAQEGPKRRNAWAKRFGYHDSWNPHCDDKVLHAPGECDVCDLYPEAQMLRVQWGINFTGHRAPGREICPAEKRRTLDTINAWGGNTPTALFLDGLAAWQPASPEEIEEAIATLKAMKADLEASAPELFLEPRYAGGVITPDSPTAS